MSNIPQGCKPFNLQEALEGKPVVTRDGRKVKIAGYKPNAQPMHKIVGWANSGSRSWQEDGTFNGTENHPADLFMAPETMDVWVVVYEFDGKLLSVTAESEKESDLIHYSLGPGRKSYGVHKITITL
jgi:hypothetical protein